MLCSCITSPNLHYAKYTACVHLFDKVMRWSYTAEDETAGINFESNETYKFWTGAPLSKIEQLMRLWLMRLVDVSCKRYRKQSSANAQHA